MQRAVFITLSISLPAYLGWKWAGTPVIPGDTGKSDIIPQIMCLVQRLLAGQQPYYPITFNGYSLYPTYLPMQWLPYVFAAWLHADYRWAPAVCMWGMCAWFFTRNARAAAAGPGSVWNVIVPCWPLIAWAVIMKNDGDISCYTVETLVAAYYLLVAMQAGRRPVWLLAAGIALCLLSRYSIVLWAPLCAAAYYIAGQRRQALAIVAILAAAFICIYYLPFLRRDPLIFLHGYQYHSKAALAEWQHDMAENKGGQYLYGGLGFTSWALWLVPGSIAHVLRVYQALHLALCTATVLGLLLLFIIRRHSISLSSFLLFSLKVYLTVFYAFIQIPYKYLYFVPVIISSALIAHMFGKSAAADKCGVVMPAKHNDYKAG